MVTFQRVSTDKEVSINSVRYRLAGPVQTQLASTYPQKQITGTGEITSDSHPWASVHTWNDWRQGIGVDRMILGGIDDRRSWFSTCATQSRNHLMKAPLATETAAPSGNPTGIIIIGELGGNIVAAWGADVRDYTHGSDSWNASARTTLAAAATDVLNLTLSGTEYLVFCFTTGYEYSSSIASWTASIKDAVKIATWDNRLWGIDAVGQLWYAWVLGTEINHARLNLTHNDVITGLFEGRDANGNTILYCSTERYLYAHDMDNCRWVRLKISISPEGLSSANHTRKAITWQDQMYLASSAGTINYIARGGEATVNPMGFDEDDGLPNAEWENIISCMAESVKELIVGGAPISSNDTGLIFAWNGIGWRVLWQATAANTPLESLHVSFISSNRLWFGYADRVWWIQLNQTNSNPKQIAGWTFTATADIHKTPWFDAAQHEVDLTAIECIVDVEDSSSNETVKVEYATDYTEGSNDASYTTLGTITTDGRTIFTFPDNGTTANVGVAFRSIRFKVTLARGGTNTNSPDVTSLTLIYRKKLRPRWMHTFNIDLTQSIYDRSPQQQRAALVTAIQLTTFIEVTFRDDDGNDRNIYVDLVAPETEEQTGHDERGIMRVRAIEQLAGAA